VDLDQQVVKKELSLGRVDNLRDERVSPEHFVDCCEVDELEIENKKHDGRVQQAQNLLRVEGSGFWVQRTGFRVKGVGFRLYD